MRRGKKAENKTLADILPAQEKYWLLSDGERYAMHGTDEVHGVLVFLLQEQAEAFHMTVGKGLPQFQPVQVSLKEMLAAMVEAGGIALAHGLRVTVGRLE